MWPLNVFYAVCYTTLTCALRPSSRLPVSGSVKNNNWADEFKDRRPDLLFAFHSSISASYLYKNNLPPSCRPWLKIDWHLCRMPRAGNSPLHRCYFVPPSINRNKSKMAPEPLKGLTGAKGLVHGVRRRKKKNKQFMWEKRSSPLRPPLAATHDEVDTAAI